MTDTSTWATGVAAYGLGPPKGVLTEAPADDSNWPRLLQLAREQRLVGLLHLAARDGALALRGGQWTQLEETQREVAAETQVAERKTANLAAAIAASGIECRVLKGPALANLDYPSPELRPFEHANLLVRSEQFVEAVHLLAQEGYTRMYPEPSRRFDARFRKGTVLVDARGNLVDVHRTIADGPYAMIVDHGELFQTSSSFEVAGTELTALGPEERLLHACFEARVGDTRPLLIRLRDIVQLVLTNELDVARIEHLSGAWGAQSLVAEAVRRAWTLLGVTDVVDLSAWATTHPTSKKERRRLLAYHTARSRTLVSFETLRSIRPRRAAFGYLRAVAFPDRSYLEGHYRGHAGRWWRVAKTAVFSGSGPRRPRERLGTRSYEDDLVELSWAQTAANTA
jgi:hypothetical protein